MADSNDIPLGLCGCGCGGSTSIAKRTQSSQGVVKGHPRRFLKGHHKSREVKSYRRVKRDGRSALHHRLRAEAALGHALPARAVIHHPDEDPWNRDARLVICQDHAYHKLLHVRARIKAAGGNPNTDRICCRCHEVKASSECYAVGYCLSCARSYYQAWRKKRRARC